MSTTLNWRIPRDVDARSTADKSKHWMNRLDHPITDPRASADIQSSCAISLIGPAKLEAPSVFYPLPLACASGWDGSCTFSAKMLQDYFPRRYQSSRSSSLRCSDALSRSNMGYSTTCSLKAPSSNPSIWRLSYNCSLRTSIPFYSALTNLRSSSTKFLIKRSATS